MIAFAWTKAVKPGAQLSRATVMGVERLVERLRSLAIPRLKRGGNAYAHAYIRKGRVFLPDVLDTSAGYRDVEPVSVYDCTSLAELRSALSAKLGAPNRRGSAPLRDAIPPAVVLRPAGMASWGRFAKGAASVSLLKSPSEVIVSEVSDLSVQDDETVFREVGKFGVDRVEHAIDLAVERMAEFCRRG